ncbi:hypothetical protein E6W39_29055 [Kitasatospora acidiphila]|uniref:Uncharacterized protein n=1 Tax=Kitasatospora acidiphila TaxID=2567942 RepID=A0A540W9E1_9ACTN|nr:hypothetical protein [Kitasatospora acidiphila]TQF05537.1 hypothetical protein E6W39_29055 [Kitasatospora acidiphila]
MDAGGALITQDTLSRLLAREKSQGERSAVRRLAADLGFADATALKTWVDAQRAAEQAALSEAERREQAATQALAAADERERRAEERLRAAIRQTALMRLGAAGDGLADAERLLDVPDDADDQAVAVAAAELKARRPELFGPAAPAVAPPAPGGAPAGGPPPRGQAPAAVGSAGLEMAKRRGYVPSA